MADDKKAPVTDDQELAKVLASMSDEANAQPGAVGGPAPQPAPAVAAVPSAPAVPEDENIPPIPATLPSTPAPAPAPIVSPLPSVNTSNATPTATGSLDDIKRHALEELRPIVSKLDLPAEEKFDALLLVIRSSDDQSLIKAAYEAAEGINDEGKKAQALLDIVKEIEYFSSQAK